MNPQSKRMSILESIANTLIGLLTSFYMQVLVFPMFGIYVSSATNVKITSIFFVISFARSYCTRRVFNKINNK